MAYIPEDDSIPRRHNQVGTGLARDRVLWLAAAVLAAVAAPYLLPGLSLEQRQAFEYLYAWKPPILLNLALFQLGLRRRSDPAERRFWHLWTGAFLCWLGQQLTLNVASGSLPVWLGEDVLYSGFYLLLLISLIRPPGTRPPEVSTGRARLEVAATAVFTAGALGYLVLVPALVERDVFATFVPSLVLYLFFDGVILLALLGARRRAADARWRCVYTWLLAGGALFLALDASELLMTAEILPWVGSGTWLDLAWLAPHAALAVASRVREPPFGAPAAAAPPPERALEEQGLLGSLWKDPMTAYVAAFPLLHFGFQGAGVLSPEDRTLRELLVLGLVLVLAGFAIVHEKLLLHDRGWLKQTQLRVTLAEMHAYYDGLTGLPNRNLLADRLQIAVSRVFRRSSRLAVLFLDLDRFKVVNDTLGHRAGDALLREAAGRLRTALRQADTLARFGGDEFVALIEDVREPADAARVAEKLHEALRPPVEIAGRELFVTASIGISLCPDDSSGADEAIRNADAALHRAKERGRNFTRLYTAGMSERALERLRLENELRRALARGELALQYQPILDVGMRTVTGYEALLRWRHPERGLLLPGEFIEISETTGMIEEIGPWVLRTACREAAGWAAASGSTPGVSVNISPRQLLGTSLVGQVREALGESGLQPERLTLEITESLALQNPQRSAATLDELHRIGVSLAIDDFGTGHSSLSQLKRFPVDTLKLDRGFVSDLHASAGDQAIMTTVVTMARTLGMRVVAEGVELEEQLDVLRSGGCHMAQGFLLGRPEWPERLSCAPQPPGPDPAAC
jgi:diguanylate cyclase (GGDEF)-like protein